MGDDYGGTVALIGADNSLYSCPSCKQFSDGARGWEEAGGVGRQGVKSTLWQMSVQHLVPSYLYAELEQNINKVRKIHYF